MSVNWQPITQEFGAQIQSVDVSQPIAAAQALVSLWCERGLLLFRGQPISPAEQVGVTRVFGVPETHKAREAWVAGHLQLTQIRYAPEHRDNAMVYDVDGIERIPDSSVGAPCTMQCRERCAPDARGGGLDEVSRGRDPEMMCCQ